MSTSTVSFVVPCFKLAHLLKECVDSILAQTYTDFEVLIMDDCSPDHTPEVAQSFNDPRVRHIRNEPNLGHLRNYHKGIALSQGRYIWLISADDKLREPYALSRYVETMEKHPEAGFVFCAGIGLDSSGETGLLQHFYYGEQDRVYPGREFIRAVLRRNSGILAPSVMVRRECYERIANFPLDMPHQGDLYIWFAWALETDVAYIGEPLVNYRSHDLSMMKDLLTNRPDVVLNDERNVLWRIRERAVSQDFPLVVRECELALGNKYANAIAFVVYGDAASAYGMTLAECEAEIAQLAPRRGEFRRIRGKMRAYLGDKHWWHGDFAAARYAYVQALADYRWLPKVWLKLALAVFGRPGFAFFKDARTRLRERRISFS